MYVALHIRQLFALKDVLELQRCFVLQVAERFCYEGPACGLFVRVDVDSHVRKNVSDDAKALHLGRDSSMGGRLRKWSHMPGEHSSCADIMFVLDTLIDSQGSRTCCR